MVAMLVMSESDIHTIDFIRDASELAAELMPLPQEPSARGAVKAMCGPAEFGHLPAYVRMLRHYSSKDDNFGRILRSLVDSYYHHDTSRGGFSR